MWFKNIYNCITTIRFLQFKKNSISKNVTDTTEQEPSQAKVPLEIVADEKIVRGAYHSMNFHKKKNELLSNIFRSPALKDEVSVIRYDFISLTHLRSFLAKNSNPDKNRIYHGFCILLASEIFNCGSKIIPDFTPIPQHANIVHGYILKEKEPIPSDLKMRLETLLHLVNEQNRYFEDPDPNGPEWRGREIKI